MARKTERFLVSKVEFDFKISCGIKILPMDPVFSSWVNVIKKALVINRSRIVKELKGHLFFSLKFKS